jgi:hypothetical protein
MVEVRFVPSLRDSPQTFSLPGTHVPGYRLFRPYGTASLLASNPLRTFQQAAEKDTVTTRKRPSGTRLYWT